MDDRRELAEARRDSAQWHAKWQGKYERLCAFVEDNIAETLIYCRLPLAHHKQNTNMLERLEPGDCLKEPRWMDDRRELAEARRDLAQWLAGLPAA